MFQKIIQLLKKTSYGFCLLTVIYTAVMMITYDISEGIYLSAITVFLFFPLCFSWSVAHEIKQNSHFTVPVRILFHYLIATLSTFLCLYFPFTGGVTRVSTHILVLFFWTIVYIVLTVLLGLIKKKFAKITNKKEAQP